MPKITWVVLITGIILIWGIIGGIQTNSSGYSCDMGFSNLLCWKWHLNSYGEFNKLLGDVINDFDKSLNDYNAQIPDYEISFDLKSNEFIFIVPKEMLNQGNYKISARKISLSEDTLVCSNNNFTNQNELRCEVSIPGRYLVQGWKDNEVVKNLNQEVAISGIGSINVGDNEEQDFIDNCLSSGGNPRIYETSMVCEN